MLPYRYRAARTVGNTRYSTIEVWKHQFRIKSSTLRNQSTRVCGISTLRTSQIAGLHAAFSSVKVSRQRKEPPNRERHGSTIVVANPIRTHENVGGAAQTAKVPAELRSRRGSMKFEGFNEPQPLQKSKASFDQKTFKATVMSTGRRRHAKFGCRKDLTHKKNPEDIKQKARLGGFSSRTAEGNKRSMRSYRSPKALADRRTGTPKFKDRPEEWQIQKTALSEKFGSAGWMPRKRLSPDTLEGIRALHAQYPDKFTTPMLADQFKVSPEAIRRILKSKWRPKEEEEERRRKGWEKRGENIWSQMVEMGIKPPKKWRDLGVGKHVERKPSRSEQLESQITIKSKSRMTASLLRQSTPVLCTIPLNGHETGVPVPMADRIL